MLTYRRESDAMAAAQRGANLTGRPRYVWAQEHRAGLTLWSVSVDKAEAPKRHKVVTQTQKVTTGDAAATT